MSGRKEQLAENVSLWLGDSRDLLPTLPRPAAIISDPPYGQRQKTNTFGRGVTGRAPGAGCRPGSVEGRRTGALHRTGLAVLWPDCIKGDEADFDPAWLLGAADILLLWGAHRFGTRLPPGSTLVWDKVPTGKIRDQGDGETAWLNVWPPRPLRIHRLLWDGVCVAGSARHEVTGGTKRAHPTQKPEALMSWCIAQARVPAGGVICDPYMGAGSTGVAAVRAGYGFVGMELEPLYFDTACRRISDELRRPSLFAGPVARPVQEALL